MSVNRDEPNVSSPVLSEKRLVKIRLNSVFTRKSFHHLDNGYFSVVLNKISSYQLRNRQFSAKQSALISASPLLCICAATIELQWRVQSAAYPSNLG